MGENSRRDPVELRIEAAELRALAVRAERIGVREQLERRAQALVEQADLIEGHSRPGLSVVRAGVTIDH